MALGDPYASLDDLKDYMQATLQGETMYDAILTNALKSVSREIDNHCHRQFNQDDAVTAREYGPDSVFTIREGRRVTHWLAVDDFYDTESLIVESGGVTWTASDYTLRPRNGIVDGQTGWAYREIHATSTTLRFDPEGDTSVTTKWGWPAVPDPVKQSCLILASETFQIKDAPFGVAGLDQFGVIRVRDNRMAESKLAPYVRDPIQVR